MSRSRIIDRQFPGIGRVRKVSGTDDADTHAAVGAMLTLLVKKGRLDLVRAWAEGLIHAMDLYDRYRTDKLDRLPSAETMRRLWTEGDRIGAADSWLSKIKARHRKKSVRYSWAGLRAMPQKASATLTDLPALVALYRESCEASNTPTMFKNARNNVRAFLRDTVGTTHPLYLAIKSIQPLDVDRAPGRPFTRTSLPVFLAAMRAAHGAAYEAMARSLAFTGMRPEEYWGEWTEWEGTAAIRVRSAKQRRGKVKYRRVFALVPVVRPTCARRTFEDKMREVTRAHVCYDLRRTFMHLMEQARIPRSRRMYYLGHSAGDVSARYEEHEVDEYLASDRKRLARYLKRSGAADSAMASPHDSTHDDVRLS